MVLLKRGAACGLLGAAIGVILLAGCGKPPTLPQPAPAARTTASIQPLDDRTIHNFFRVTPRIYSGSQPVGPAAFQRLSELGVRTIISVDGANPDDAAAAVHGIRYIHLPMGYDRVGAHEGVLLTKAMKETQGPVFIHCHHGKHRGPAAAAACAIVDAGWSNQQAIDWMNKAGTSRDYQGLFDSIAAFKAPDDAALTKAGPLTPRAQVPPMAQAMVAIDERWERLLAARKSGFKSVPGHPDIEPQHEALQLAEGYRELARRDEAKAKGEDFVKRLTQADAEAVEMHAALKAWKAASHPPEGLAGIAAKADVIAQSCKSCHVRYRN